MPNFPIHDVESAPADSQAILKGSQRQMGFVPNLFGILAESPTALKAYTQLGGLLDSSSLSPLELQVVLIQVSVLNGCDYCVAAHSTLADAGRLPQDVITAVRDARPIPDPKLEALRRFTRQVVEYLGQVPEADVQAFLEAGYSRASLLDVVTATAMKTLSNYTNHMTKTPVDAAFAARAWTSPEAA